MSDSVRVMTAADLALVLEWRNHPDVRSCMLSQLEISLEEHRQWFDRSLETDSKRLLIFENEAEPMGFVSFNLAGGGVSEWGFYVRPHAPKGTGTQLGIAAIRYGFDDLKLQKICGRVLGGNDRSIRFHEKLGFKREGVLREHHFDSGHYQDIVCFGLLRREWK